MANLPVSSFIRTRCAPRISITPTNCAIDLDPVAGVDWPQIATSRRWSAPRSTISLVGCRRRRARRIHVYVRIERRWVFDQVRRARSPSPRVEARAGPGDEQMVEGRAHGVFPRLQPEREGPHHRSATPCARPPTRGVGPLTWEEIATVIPPISHWHDAARFATIGDRHHGIDERPLLARSAARTVAAQEHEGQGDAPWPPNYKKQAANRRACSVETPHVTRR